ALPVVGFAPARAKSGQPPPESCHPEKPTQPPAESVQPPTRSAQTPARSGQSATKAGSASIASAEVDSQPGAAAADYTQYRDGFVNRTKQDSPVYDDGCSLPNGGGGFRRDVSKAEPVPGILAEYLPGNRGEGMEHERAKRIPAGAVQLFQVI